MDNREILFRGWHKTRGWIYGGCFIARSGKVYIIEQDGATREILPETLGQYTGLTDRYGKDIFEGDVVLYGKRLRYVVTMKECGYLSGISDDDKDGTPFPDTLFERASMFEIIGNIHDNPNILNPKS